MRIVSVSIATALSLSGCAVTSVDGVRMPLRSDVFSTYIEAVFRRQNDVATELAFAADDEAFGSDRHAMLTVAELDLQNACSGLNQIARAEPGGESVEGFGALKRARTAPECELATDSAALILGSD